MRAACGENQANDLALVHDRRVVVTGIMVMWNVVMPRMVAFHDHGFSVGEAGEAENGKAKNEQGFHMGFVGWGVRHYIGNRECDAWVKVSQPEKRRSQ